MILGLLKSACYTKPQAAILKNTRIAHMCDKLGFTCCANLKVAAMLTVSDYKNWTVCGIT